VCSVLICSQFLKHFFLLFVFFFNFILFVLPDIHSAEVPHILREYFRNQYIMVLAETRKVVCETSSGTRHGKIGFLSTVISYY